MNTSHFWTVLQWITRVSFNQGLFEAGTADVSLSTEGQWRGCHPRAFILQDSSVPCCSGATRHAALLVIRGTDTQAGAALHCGDPHYLSFCVTSHVHTQFCHSTILRIGVRRKHFQTIMAKLCKQATLYRPHFTLISTWKRQNVSNADTLMLNGFHFELVFEHPFILPALFSSLYGTLPLKPSK